MTTLNIIHCFWCGVVTHAERISSLCTDEVWFSPIPGMEPWAHISGYHGGVKHSRYLCPYCADHLWRRLQEE